ncbi:MAG: hypothetical protein KDD25_00900 [Bdellovibrionales bacterium]|nr:hypothetical protein [Bdellovibrionales bacterium]
MNLILTRLLFLHVFFGLIFSSFVALAQNESSLWFLHENIPPAGEVYGAFDLERGYNQARELLDYYPIDRHHIVSFGPTLTVASTFVRQMAGRKHQRNFVEAPLLSTRKGLQPFTFQSPQNVLEEDYFWEQLIPPPEELGNKRIVIARALFLGQSLDEITLSLSRFMLRNGYKKELDFFFVFGTTEPDSMRTAMLRLQEQGFDLNLHYVTDPRFHYGYINRTRDDAFHVYASPKVLYGKYILVNFGESYSTFPTVQLRRNAHHVELQKLVSNYLKELRRPKRFFERFLSRFSGCWRTLSKPIPLYVSEKYSAALQ